MGRYHPGMLLYIGIGIALLVAGVLVAAAMKPDSFRVERSAVILAAPDKVHALIDDFHAWTAWSLWEKIDPGLKRTYAGPQKGVGAVYGWEGNKKVGRGRMEILESAPASRVKIKLDFLEPFEAHNTAEFTLQPAGVNGTSVNWAMYGPSNFMAKLMQVFMSMDRLVGKDFEKGLAAMKAAAEGA